MPTEESPLIPLKQAVETVNAVGRSTEDKMEALIKAFELFNQETQRLESAYKSLKGQFHSVNFELEESNRQLTLKIAELDVVTYYLDSILSNISQGILFIDLIGNITTYNTAAQHILEVDRLEVLFEPFWHSFSDTHFGFSMSRALKSKRAPSTLFTSITLPSGLAREIEVDTTFVLQKKQEVSFAHLSPTLEVMKGLIILIRDVTDLRRLQAVANRNDRLKELGEMAAMVAHEIRNPLGGIQGFASLLQRDLADRPEQQKMAQYIVEGTDVLNRLVNNILSYTRPLEIHTEYVDILPMIRSLHTHLSVDRALTREHEITVDTTMSEARVSVDIAQLRAALLNLLLNAIQAMPHGGKIVIKIGKEKHSLVIAVIDTGEGIAPAHLEKIFSPFFTTKPQGNGLGLSEVYKITQVHGGTIDVASELGVGSIFTIRMPYK